MVITILAEPRSGSTNLVNWFIDKKEFTILYEPISSPDKIWYKNNIPPVLWQYDTNHLLVKETFNIKDNFSDILSISDKIIILYRDNNKEQFESWVSALKTNNWDNQWVYSESITKEEDTSYFNKLKEEFKINYLNSNYFKISYEELYYNNGFQKIVDYLKLDSVKNEYFPYGQKYRLEKTKAKSLI